MTTYTLITALADGEHISDTGFTSWEEAMRRLDKRRRENVEAQQKIREFLVIETSLDRTLVQRIDISGNTSLVLNLAVLPL